MTLRLRTEPNFSAHDWVARLGAVYYVLNRVKHHGLRRDWLLPWLERASELELLQVYYQDYGFPVGYLIWGFLERDVQQRLLEKPDTRLHISEWTEGKEPWILDFAALKDNQRGILRHAARNLFAEYEFIHYVRRDLEGSVLRLKRLRNRYWEGERRSASPGPFIRSRDAIGPSY